MTEKTKKAKKVIVIPAREDRNSENGQEKNKRRVAAYARVSTNKESQQTSYEAQVAMVCVAPSCFLSVFTLFVSVIFFLPFAFFWRLKNGAVGSDIRFSCHQFMLSPGPVKRVSPQTVSGEDINS